MFELTLVDLIVCAATILGFVFTLVMAELERGTRDFCRGCAIISIVIALACCALLEVSCFLGWLFAACIWLKRGGVIFDQIATAIKKQSWPQ